jgi:pimeloyl-ACP methyl ester carboxylesterase
MSRGPAVLAVPGQPYRKAGDVTIDRRAPREQHRSMKTIASGRRAAIMGNTYPMAGVLRVYRPWRVSLAAGSVLLAAAALMTTGCGGSGPGGTDQSRLLSAADLPAGWSATPVNQKAVQTSAPCLSGLPAKPQGFTYAAAAFVEGTSIPSFGEALATGPQAQRQWQSLDSSLARCQTATITVAGQKAAASIRPLSFPRVGSWSSAYAWTLTISGIPVDVDLILFRAGNYQGYLTYTAVGTPTVATVQAFADAAAAKAERGSTTPVPDSVSITSVPVRTVATKLGTVAYRVIGNGPPLVMIMGFGGTMETWDPRLVNGLAQRYRVVIFDNAGLGETQALPAPLSVDAMANQTSALITALGLGRPDVLGWSMGSMIAQALAVLHPDQVNRLVLSASYPGDGTTVRPPQQAINALHEGGQQALSVLFPAGQAGAANAYAAATSSYPAAPADPPAIVTAQGHAIDAWWAGQDPAGARDATITAPTLIADGAADQLDPAANSHTLAGLIPGAKLLTLFPDAGHAFLFQDQAAFVPQVESFLG